MSEQDDLRDRLDRLERLVEAIAARVGVPVGVPPAPQASAPPPQVAEPLPNVASAPVTPGSPPLQASKPARVRPVYQPKAQPQAPKERSSAEKADTEFVIGARLMPIVAGLLVIVGFIYLVALALNRGWINSRVQFAGELVLCSVFVLTGLRKVNEKENFGSILVAVGISGFYLSFMGAFAYKGLLRAEGVVAAFVLTSFASHFFSWWRSSKPFLFLGLLGGLAASQMAWRNNDLALIMGLHGLAMLPTWFILPRKKWETESILVWVATTFLTVPVLFESETGQPWVANFTLAAFWLYALIGGQAALRAREKKGNNSRELTFMAVFGIAVLPLALPIYRMQPNLQHASSASVLHSPWGSLAFLGYAGLAWLGSRYKLDRETSGWLSSAAVCVALIVPPLTFSPFQSTLVFAGLAALSATVARAKAIKLASVVSVVHIGLAYATYLLWILLGPQPATTVHLCVLAVLALVTAMVAGLSAPREREEAWAIPAGVVLWMVTVQAAWVYLGSSGSTSATIFAWGCTVFVAAAALLGGLLRWKYFTVFVNVVASLAVLGLLAVMNSGESHSLPKEGTLLIAALVSGAILTVTNLKVCPEFPERILAVSASVLWIPVARIAWLVLRGQGIDDASAVLWSLMVPSVPLALWAIRKRVLWASVVASAIWSFSGFVFIGLAAMYQMTATDWTRFGEMRADIVLLVSCSIMGIALSRALPSRAEPVTLACSLPMGLLVGRLAYLQFVWPPFGLQNIYVIELVCCFCALVTGVVAIVKKWKYLALGTWANLALCGCLYPAMKVPALGFAIPPGRTVDKGQDMLVMVALLTVSLVAAKAAVRGGEKASSVCHATALVNWAIVFGIFMAILEGPPFRIKFDAAMSVSWTAYAALLLVLGFKFNQPALRYWALAIFASTITKVVAYDLAYLDPVIRVIVLMVLGVVMFGGGFLYIRSQKAKESQPG